ncbi:hypothetical protein HBH56_172760 [Parastagonospora nodorum]|uniref:ferric-chelate reductase (NADPH) n=1 Tax=Phaeosphaeria nodorum (strain SN15 / ATCC MYA-4574 / FGSC 10173) TaxID=321614 RepID=A0A7U2EXD6_PHANO|nr:hypothetical protein HBH56_172760 [Parastagonospora nodorum]QRC94626.1 hypothetical protein JI435_078510 [Parastagonospora nodorum SN15]KAH3928403.1 hypothetical protein HBH54_141320 [Parastagonospora nodorum]KAH3983967.1 hypothetical protein HBH52_057550 [Parastagonospora nodorum]KAH4057727.1 hypothetical protein HBH50_237410 [Parastagonospora nodorum]
MSHHHMSMGMGSAALPKLYDFPKIYWAVVGSAIGVATLVNLYNHILCRQRLSAAKSGTRTPAKPSSWLTLGVATVYALTREASNYSLYIPFKKRVFRFPSVGRASLVLANAVTLIVLCLYGLDLTGRFTKEDVAFRCGVVTLGQVPLIFLLAGKNNIVGYLSGVSYERLNWLHRWCARTMLLTATIHMGYFFASWDQYKYIPYKLKNDELAWKGLAAWSVLVWIVLSSMTPIRGWNYELFVVQHLVSFGVFLGFVYIHIPKDTKGYVWVPVALFLFDRGVRATRVLYANISLFHPKQRGQGLLACKAEFTPLPHNTTRVVIENPPISWTPGQHVFLSCHSVVPLQSHPFTVASIPEDGVMEFLIKSKRGGTKRFFKHAEKSSGLSDGTSKTKTVTIEGPYGALRPLRQFDSVVLLAGSTGATFTLPLLRDILHGWRETSTSNSSSRSFFSRQTGAVARHVRFVWVVKSRGQLSWFGAHLSSIAADFEILQDRLRDVKLEMGVYITCDERFTNEHNTLLSNITAPQKKTSTPTLRHKSIPSDEKAMLSTNVRDSTSSTTSITPCNCRSAIIEKGANTQQTTALCCCRQNSRPESTSPSPSSITIHPSITLHTGRPQTRDIIRRSLESALGESAVVVCGPTSLVADVKRDVWALSDERAVHKGTGAQGIYLHTESFSY